MILSVERSATLEQMPGGHANPLRRTWVGVVAASVWNQDGKSWEKRTVRQRSTFDLRIHPAGVPAQLAGI